MTRLRIDVTHVMSHGENEQGVEMLSDLAYKSGMITAHDPLDPEEAGRIVAKLVRQMIADEKGINSKDVNSPVRVSGVPYMVEREDFRR